MTNYLVYVTGSIENDTTQMRVRVSAKDVASAEEKAITHVIASLDYPLFDKYEVSVRRV